MSQFKFGNIDKLKRNREIEGVAGTEIGLPGGISLIALCASDANPAWRRGGEDFLAELKRLSRAHASDERVKRFLAEQLARMLVKDWSGVVDQLPEDLEIVLVLEVEFESALVAVPQHERRRLALDERRRAPHRIALRALDLDDVGAHVGELHAAEGTGEMGREIEDDQTVERACHVAYPRSLRRSSSVLAHLLTPRWFDTMRPAWTIRNRGAPLLRGIWARMGARSPGQYRS